MRSAATIVLVVTFSAWLAPAAVAEGYRNPVVAGFHPDPTICRVGRDYYLANSSFAYAPGIPLFHSRDLVSWRPIGYAVRGEEALPLPHADLSAGLWAPTLRHHNRKFYLVTTNKTQGGNFIVTARDPAGPWSKPIWFDKEGWDPSLFFDDDGKVYLTRNGEGENGAFGILQYQIDPDTGKKLSAAKIIWSGSGGFGAEGPHMYKVNGIYYLLAAEGGTHAGHMVTVARAPSAWGPFESNPNNPILSHRDHLLERIAATGHGDLVQTHTGQWWMVFLGIRNFASPMHMMHTLGRETFLAPVRWQDGWPVVNEGRPVHEMMPEAPLPRRGWGMAPVRTVFSAASLGLEWNTLRHPASNAISLTANPRALTLCAQEAGLSTTRGAPALLARRQEHHDVKVSTQVQFEPRERGDEAGLTVFMDERHHYDLALAGLSGARRVFVRRTVEDLETEVAEVQVADGAVTLEIEANPWTYMFFVRTTQGRQSLGKARSKLLSTEVAGGFTGMYFGLYSQGLQPGHPACARFAWFDYQPLPSR